MASSTTWTRPADAIELTPEELEEYELEAAARYANMIGLNMEPRERALHSRKAARRLAPVIHKGW